jgi:D-alanyl-D-alanine carboxypeptidase
MNHPYAVVMNGLLVGGKEAQQPVPWWSFTKTILAAAALVLVRDGRLELTERIAGQTYSLRQLLRHTAGLANYTDLTEYQLAVEGADSPWSVEEMLARVDAERPPFEAGKMWKYSNLGYFYVRRIIEETTGQDIGLALNDLVFRPLNIDEVWLGTQPDDMARTVWGNPTGYDPRWVYHGLLIGPPVAAAAALDHLLRGDLLPSHLLADMRNSIALGHEISGRPWIDFGYGLGLMTAAGPVGRCFGHTGHDVTSVAAVYHFADIEPARTVAVFSSGGDQAEVEWLAVELARSLDRC